MPLPHHVFAPAFRHRKLGWFFTLLVGIMVYLASFAAASEATLSAVTFTWDKDMESRLTVEIPQADDESSLPQTDRVERILAALLRMPEVETASAVPQEDAMRLLKPWINQAELLQALPIPTLIDVTRKSGASLSATNVQNQLKSVVSDIHVDDHAAWLGDLGHLLRGMSAVAALVVLLTTLTLIMTVSLLCRGIMATEHEAIALLHTMGAEDKDIALHFQFHARRMAMPASFGGFILAIMSAGLLLFFIRHLVDLSSLQPLHWVGLGCSVFIVPLAAILITALAARLSVLRLLHGMP